MTREEQIVKAAKDNCHDNEAIVGFIEGAKWADKHPVNVWHKPSEMPEEGERILVHFNKYYGDAHTFLGFEADDWRDWCKKYDVVSWAYISDLLTKGGE